jgi:hypothetical protein
LEVREQAVLSLTKRLNTNAPIEQKPT